MPQHLESTCLNVQTPMERLWLPPGGSLTHACLYTRTDTRAGRSVRNESITLSQWEWLYYLAITLNSPWNTVLRNWPLIVHKKERTINLLRQQRLWDAWKFPLKWDTKWKRKGFPDICRAHLKLFRCNKRWSGTDGRWPRDRKWKSNQRRKGLLNKHGSKSQE